MAKKTVATKKRVVKVDGVGQLHVHSSFNNIIVTLTNGDGQVISWSSAGKMGFRGSKKNTPYAAQMAAQDCAKVAFDLGLRKVKAYVKGPGNGRESAIRTIHGKSPFASGGENGAPQWHRFGYSYIALQSKALLLSRD